MGIKVRIQHPLEPGRIKIAQIKLERDLRSCMHCKFFYGSSRQCIAKKCVEDESRTGKMVMNKESICFGCPYRQSGGYCFPCMKKLLERKGAEKVAWKQEEKKDG